ncbi:hypothetical protein CEXT_49751 [Caerostris extrusa]|uniref:Uncharacterized protein n=1 Tax=Caerostris extrusa TaxID=172846 RepID=A0AAV4XCI6_CAEEX|nr:hypothetical protein CEXT_49751 [Caerostris extrusa]
MFKQLPQMGKNQTMSHRSQVETVPDKFLSSEFPKVVVRNFHSFVKTDDIFQSNTKSSLFWLRLKSPGNPIQNGRLHRSFHTMWFLFTVVAFMLKLFAIIG